MSPNHLLLKAKHMKIMYNAIQSCQKLAIASAIFVFALDAEAQPSGPTALPPYTVSVFAAPPAGMRAAAKKSGKSGGLRIG
jgi:hypothetical protein